MIDKKLLSTICKLYYYDELTQNQISEILKIERTKVSRLLKKAKELGIVKIIINDMYLEQLDLETRLKKKYGLKGVQLVASDENILVNIAEAAHAYLDTISENKETIGITWGKTIREFSLYKPLNVNKRIDFIPLLGGYNNMKDYMSINSMIYNLATLYKGTPYFIESPLIVDTPGMKEQIMNSTFFKQIIEIWEKLQIAVVGIGALEKSSNVLWEIGLSELKQLNNVGEIKEKTSKQKAIGEICSKFYDIDGKIVKTILDDRVIGIGLEKLTEIPYSIGIAGGVEKTDAIYGAVMGKYINVLITDMETGKKLLDK